MSERDKFDILSDFQASNRAMRLGFLLVDDFALMSYASVVEPFRAANRLSGRTLYEWRHYGVDGLTVLASNGLTINVDDPFDAAAPCDLLLVCAGGNPASFDHKPTFDRLRRLAAKGSVIGGVSGGPYILAHAGLLDGFRCTIHWEHEQAFIEAFPNVEVERGLYCVDRRRVTCAGGTAGLDLAIDVIRRAHGATLGQQVSDWYIRTQDREGEGAQRASVNERYGIFHKGLTAALAAMEDSIASPLTREELAAIASVSVRHLERLFRTHLRTSLQGHYMRIRLEAAMRLMRETNLSRIEVAIACGFASASHFSRAFSRRFSVSPSSVRQSG